MEKLPKGEILKSSLILIELIFLNVGGLRFVRSIGIRAIEKSKEINMTLISKISGILSAVIIVSGSTAFAVNHDETFLKMQEMVLSASPEELEGIMNNYCKNMFAATMTATDIHLIR